MKKCDINLDSYSKSDTDEAASPLGKKPKDKKTRHSINSKMKRNMLSPGAPHNTSDYLMEQHKLNLYDPEDLLGEILGMTFEIKLLKRHSIN